MSVIFHLLLLLLWLWLWLLFGLVEPLRKRGLLWLGLCGNPTAHFSCAFAVPAKNDLEGMELKRETVRSL